MYICSHAAMPSVSRAWRQAEHSCGSRQPARQLSSLEATRPCSEPAVRAGGGPVSQPCQLEVYMISSPT